MGPNPAIEELDFEGELSSVLSIVHTPKRAHSLRLSSVLIFLRSPHHSAPLAGIGGLGSPFPVLSAIGRVIAYT